MTIILDPLNTSDLIAILGIIIGIMVSYFIYKLTTRITFFESMKHRSEIQTVLAKKISEIAKGQNAKVEFYNVRLFKNDHFKNNNRHWLWGYRYRAAELESFGVDGVEVIRIGTEIQHRGKKISALKVGLVPYKYIQYIDADGDDTTNRMIIYAKCPAYKFPFKKTYYYKINKDKTIEKYFRLNLTMDDKLYLLSEWFKRKYGYYKNRRKHA